MIPVKRCIIIEFRLTVSNPHSFTWPSLKLISLLQKFHGRHHELMDSYGVSICTVNTERMEKLPAELYYVLKFQTLRADQTRVLQCVVVSCEEQI